MYTYLIVDDEMIERKGIRMLLSRMNIRENILEASNGEEALEVFEKEKIDVLLTDINMPFMDGIELLSRIHEEYPGTETVIFSGYDEFSYAKKAISYGVSAYILKPVNPEEFEKVVGEINEKLAKSEREEKRKDESMEFLREHLLYLMVNGQSRNAMQEKTQTLLDMSFVRDFCRMVLLECANNYFEQVNSEQIEKMQSDLQMPFHYLNLNPQQSILFFSEEPDGGWEAFGRKLYHYIREMWDQECFLAVSGEITPDGELYDAFAQTEQLMERRFYHTGNHVFLPFQEEQSEVLVQIDAEILIRQIQQDIRMKDLESLREHFDQFCEKYEHQTIFSQIYIKFMFSNLLKEIYDNLERKDERELDREIDALYHSSNMAGVIQAVRMGIDRLETVFRADGGVAKRREVEQIKQYIRENYSDSGMGVDQLAREVGMTPNYLSSIFKKNTGETVCPVSSETGEGIRKLKELLAEKIPEGYGNRMITGNLVSKDDLVLLVMPQDIQAPKGRLILPQVQTLRELLDKRCLIMSVTTDRYPAALQTLSRPPKLIITDSQVFPYIYENKPKESMLTSFSVLFAAYKGDLSYYIEGAKAIDSLKETSHVLIAECCTHAPLKEDIGRVKIPRMLKKRFGEKLQVELVSGTDFPDDLTGYDLIIQCGACMFNRKYVMYRIDRAKKQQVPVTNYGITIAHLTGILDHVALPE